MKILVTGGCGFVGTHLVQRLAKEGHEVVVLDLKAPEQPAQGVQYIKGDIRDRSDVARAIKGCGAVFHLAALTNVRDGNDDADYEVNFLGAKNVFEQAKQNSLKVVFTSSAAVYGDAGHCTEETEPKPISQYGRSKLKAENFLRKEMPDSFIVRFFNLYGPGGQGAPNIFCRHVPNYTPVRIFGNGMQTRDYVHVNDAVDALMLGLGGSGTYNIGTGQEISLLELLDHVRDITKAKPDLKFELPIDKEIKRSKADISKIKAELGWQPKIDLRSGLAHTLQAEGWKPLP